MGVGKEGAGYDLSVTDSCCSYKLRKNTQEYLVDFFGELMFLHLLYALRTVPRDFELLLLIFF